MFDYGAWTDPLRAFFESIRSLTGAERARVTYSLGDEPPLFFDAFEDLLSERMWARSQALQDAVDRVWRERLDEAPPLLFPRGRVFGNGIVVANAYAQWLLLCDAISQKLPDPLAIRALETRCTAPWMASVDHPRYGLYQQEVVTFLDDARILPLRSAIRLAKAWQRDMGGYLFGRPGEDWFPGSLGDPRPELVSARLAAVDASRIEPPDELDVRAAQRLPLRPAADGVRARARRRERAGTRLPASMARCHGRQPVLHRPRPLGDAARLIPLPSTPALPRHAARCRRSTIVG